MLMKKGQVIAWLRITRLQFYPMTLIAYSLGAAIAVITAIVIWRQTLVHETLGLLMVVTVAHCIILITGISRLVKSAGLVGRIDGTMQLALSYIVWFGAIALTIHLVT
jgi:hypothetical protein